MFPFLLGFCSCLKIKRMSDYLPQEIIIQILHKLPIKSLVRCMCVSKSWHSLITNPSFISTHLTLTISSNTNLLLFRLCSEEYEHFSLHFDNNQQLCQYMVLDYPFKKNSYCSIIGTVNGIICLVDNMARCTDTFILWNPLIKKSITLPKPSLTFMNPSSYKTFIGFGFDSKTNDYKVLRIIQQFKKEKVFMEVELYSLNTNSWKRMTCVTPKYGFIEENQKQMQPFVNGVVHWIAFQYMGPLEYRNVVLGFDMGDEVFCEIKLPDSLANVSPYEMFVRKYGDSSIAVIQNDYSYSHPLKCHIWVMKEYGVVESWTKLLSFEEQGGRLPRVLGFRKSGEVLIQTSENKIVSYDPQNKGVQDLGLRNRLWFAFVDGYVESLILLDNANAEIDVTEDESEKSMFEKYEERIAIFTRLLNREPATRR